MKKHCALSQNSIINALQKDYDIAVATFTKLTGGADLDAESYKVEATNKQAYFVKVTHRSYHPVSMKLQLLLHDTGIKHILTPLKTTHGDIVHTIDDYIFTLYPYIQGSNGFDCSLNQNQWIELGRTLKAIHAWTIPTPLRNSIKEESYTAKWRDYIRGIYQKHSTQSSHCYLTNFMQTHKNTILRLVEIATYGATNLKNNKRHFVLCHGDMHAGNILLQDSGDFFIVDWDAPIMAPKERDLMFIGGGVGNIWNNEYEEKLFYKGYEQASVDITALAYYRCERILEDIAIYYQTLSTSRKTNSAEIFTLLIEQFKPNGVVDIALNTAKHI